MSRLLDLCEEDKQRIGVLMQKISEERSGREKAEANLAAWREKCAKCFKLLRLYQKLYQELQQEHEAALGAGNGGQTRGTREKVEGDAQCRRGGAGRAEEVEVLETEGRIKRDDSLSRSSPSRNNTATSSAVAPAAEKCDAAVAETVRRSRKSTSAKDVQGENGGDSHHKGNGAKSPARQSSSSSTSTSSTPDERNRSPAARDGPPPPSSPPRNKNFFRDSLLANSTLRPAQLALLRRFMDGREEKKNRARKRSLSREERRTTQGGSNTLFLRTRSSSQAQQHTTLPASPQQQQRRTNLTNLGELQHPEDTEQEQHGDDQRKPHVVFGSAAARPTAASFPKKGVVETETQTEESSFMVVIDEDEVDRGSSGRVAPPRQGQGWSSCAVRRGAPVQEPSSYNYPHQLSTPTPARQSFGDVRLGSGFYDQSMFDLIQDLNTSSSSGAGRSAVAAFTSGAGGGGYIHLQEDAAFGSTSTSGRAGCDPAEADLQGLDEFAVIEKQLDLLEEQLEKTMLDNRFSTAAQKSADDDEPRGGCRRASRIPSTHRRRSSSCAGTSNQAEVLAPVRRHALPSPRTRHPAAASTTKQKPHIDIQMLRACLNGDVEVDEVREEKPDLSHPLLAAPTGVGGMPDASRGTAGGAVEGRAGAQQHRLEFIATAQVDEVPTSQPHPLVHGIKPASWTVASSSTAAQDFYQQKSKSAGHYTTYRSCPQRGGHAAVFFQQDKNSEEDMRRTPGFMEVEDEVSELISLMN
ncbi:unnamed protein product [Amoebophrya sp. A120]|nr:unnamed protein product [Amoebophrya sp. A120]|eukprot:GSA120T00014726001.1